MSENRPTRTYDDECPKHPVFGDCALVDGPLFGGRPNCRLQHLRPDRPHHASGSHRTEPIENADRSKRKGASRYTVLRGRSAATSALDNGDLLIEGLVLCSSKAVHKRMPPMPRRFGRTTPYPRAGFPVQLSGGDSRGQVNLVAVREALSGERLSPEYTPPGLDEVEPRRSLGDESVLYPRVPFEPLPYQGALSWIFRLSAIRGDQADKTPRDSPLYLPQQLQVALGVPRPRGEGERLAGLYSQGAKDPHFVWASAVFQGRFDAVPIWRPSRSSGGKARGLTGPSSSTQTTVASGGGSV